MKHSCHKRYTQVRDAYGNFKALYCTYCKVWKFPLVTEPANTMVLPNKGATMHRHHATMMGTAKNIRPQRRGKRNEQI